MSLTLNFGEVYSNPFQKWFQTLHPGDRCLETIDLFIPINDRHLDKMTQLAMGLGEAQIEAS